MIYFIDIDDTICRLDNPMDYSSAKPIPKAIEKINKLHKDGHTIIFWTARGTSSGIDWTKLTKFQLSSWGVNYHELRFGKPVYDFFIDDKNINSEDWLNGKN
jgi:hydroxymethylpyrimidine pyrophosphatase-like HAD family hydrolase